METIEIYALQPSLLISGIVLPADKPMTLSWACRPAPDTRDCQVRRPQYPIFGTAKPGHRHVNSAVSPAQGTMILLHILTEQDSCLPHYLQQRSVCRTSSITWPTSFRLACKTAIGLREVDKTAQLPMFSRPRKSSTASDGHCMVHSSLQHLGRHCHGRHHPHTLADHCSPLAIALSKQS